MGLCHSVKLRVSTERVSVEGRRRGIWLWGRDGDREVDTEEAIFGWAGEDEGVGISQRRRQKERLSRDREESSQLLSHTR